MSADAALKEMLSALMLRIMSSQRKAQRPPKVEWGLTARRELGAPVLRLVGHRLLGRQ